MSVTDESIGWKHLILGINQSFPCSIARGSRWIWELRIHKDQLNKAKLQPELRGRIISGLGVIRSFESFKSEMICFKCSVRQQSSIASACWEAL